jgi:hypothetical protein
MAYDKDDRPISRSIRYRVTIGVAKAVDAFCHLADAVPKSLLIEPEKELSFEQATRGRSIVGMFLVLDSAEHEHFSTGEIVAAVGNCYLIQFDRLELD